MPMRLIAGYSLLALLVLAAAVTLFLILRRRRHDHDMRWARRGRH